MYSDHYGTFSNIVLVTASAEFLSSVVDYHLRIEETVMLTVIVYICRAKPKTLIFQLPIDRAKTPRRDPTIKISSLANGEFSFFSSLLGEGNFDPST